VPFTDSYALPTRHSETGYRHYYGTTHWVTGVRIDENDLVWYRVLDDKWHTVSFYPGHHLRIVGAEELTPALTDRDG